VKEIFLLTSPANIFGADQECRYRVSVRHVPSCPVIIICWSHFLLRGFDSLISDSAFTRQLASLVTATTDNTTINFVYCITIR